MFVTNGKLSIRKGETMKLLYGTNNKAKLASMRNIIKNKVNVEIVSSEDLNFQVLHIEESGKNPLENAIIKAKAYYEAYKMPTFACDSGLFFEGIEDAYQPGTYIRRVNGKELSDEEMISYYGELAAQSENGLIGKYQNAICCIIDEDTMFASMDDSFSEDAFRIAPKPHPRRVLGFPINSLAQDINTGQYHYDMIDRAVSNEGFEKACCDFFTNVLKEVGE